MFDSALHFVKRNHKDKKMNASCVVRRKIVKLTFNHSYTNSGNPQHLFTKIVANNKLQIIQNVALQKPCHLLVVEM